MRSTFRISKMRALQMFFPGRHPRNKDPRGFRSEAAIPKYVSARWIYGVQEVRQMRMQADMHVPSRWPLYKRTG
jgi:hypothetical protein